LRNTMDWSAARWVFSRLSSIASHAARAVTRRFV
jgi:hypothetical protein